MNVGERFNLLRTCLSVERPARRSRVLVAAACAVSLGLCGCGPKRVRADFRNYEAAYADTSNRQLLLNLARLRNHDPAYFFKMGQITSAYRMQGSLTGTGQMTSSANAIQIPNGGGSTGLVYENDPTFQFIPVNDDTNARLLMAPIQPETFDALYQQGWRLDQLFRLLVDRIEITEPVWVEKDGKYTVDCGIEVIRNVPPHSLDANSTEDQDQLSSYVTFLRLSALVYQLQRRGHLVLGSKETFKPYDYAVLPPSQEKNKDDKDKEGTANDSGGTGDKKGGDASAGGMSAKDLSDAIEKSNLWKQTPQGWQLGHKVFTPVFYVTPMTLVPTTQDGKPSMDYVADIAVIAPDVNLPELKTGQALDNALAVLSRGFSIGMQDSQQETQAKSCPVTRSVASLTASANAGSLEGPGGTVLPPGNWSAKLILRSIVAVMTAAAQEQDVFEQLEETNPCIPHSPYERKVYNIPENRECDSSSRFVGSVPPIEQIPLLRLMWNGKPAPGDSPLVAVKYQNADYWIADEKADPTRSWTVENQYWNRDTFRLINALASQVTVDISKFPLPQILQLHTD